MNQLSDREFKMAEYIERESLLNALSESTEPFNVASVFRTIKRQSEADVALVRHGKWEAGNPICPICGENKFKNLDADIWADWMPKYCPNCGSSMVKDEIE